MKYKAKHAKTATLQHYKKSAVLLIAMVLIITVGAGATLAYLIDQSTAVSNTFQPAQVSCIVDEEFDVSTKTKSNVKIKNTSDVTAYIRASVIVTWKDTAGNVYWQVPSKGTDYTDWTSGTDWVTGNDGFYYYTKSVAAKNGETTNLINAISPMPNPPSGYCLSVEIVAEAIQAKPADAVASWGNTKVDVVGNEAGTILTVTNK